MLETAIMPTPQPVPHCSASLQIRKLKQVPQKSSSEALLSQPQWGHRTGTSFFRGSEGLACGGLSGTATLGTASDRTMNIV